MARRQHLTLSLLLIVFLFLSLSYFFTSAPALARDAAPQPAPLSGNHESPAQASTDNHDARPVGDGDDKAALVKDGAPSATTSAASVSTASSAASTAVASASPSAFAIDVNNLPSLEGDSIAPKLENETLKAELGQATWRFLHTMAARFPEKPTKDERTTFETFMHLFGRLYPCGDCARHFREILQKYPPQSSSRSAAAGWLCFAHNVVNERLEKEMFDCNNIGDFYDCGCADDEKGDKRTDKTDKADDKAGKESTEAKDKKSEKKE